MAKRLAVAGTATVFNFAAPAVVPTAAKRLAVAGTATVYNG
jgi:hypothetical protein